MKITLSQLNVMVGDKSKNIDYIDEAADSGADPALPGEMVLSAVGRV
jgi:predicted amidohydrolase